MAWTGVLAAAARLRLAEGRSRGQAGLADAVARQEQFKGVASNAAPQRLLRPSARAVADVTEPMLALSIRQPWAWAVIHAGKDVENRSSK